MSTRNTFLYWYPVASVQQLLLAPLGAEVVAGECVPEEAEAHLLSDAKQEACLCGRVRPDGIGRTSKRPPSGRGICKKCVSIYKTLPTPEMRALQAWVKGEARV